MIYSNPRDRAVDDAAAGAFTETYGERAASLPPVAIVIAAYNEQGAIGPVVEALPDQVCGLATAAIVVADGCLDGTAKAAVRAGAMVCDVPVNRGQGAALRLGYRLARAGGAAYIVTTDADGQYNPAEMDRVLAPVVAGEADFATGSRRLGSQETREIIRRAGVRFFAGTISMLTGQKVSDTTFGLRAMRAQITAAVQLEQPQYQASELLIGVITHGYKVAEVPATIHRRRIGESKKGQNPLYQLHLPGVNNLFYGLRFARVVYGTWWRERQRARRAGSARWSGSEGSPRISMALTSNRPSARVWRKACGTLGIRFGRFAVAAIAAFATSEVMLTICAGPLNLTATWASLLSWFAGALVSYLLSAGGRGSGRAALTWCARPCHSGWYRPWSSSSSRWPPNSPTTRRAGWA